MGGHRSRDYRRLTGQLIPRQSAEFLMALTFNSANNYRTILEVIAEFGTVQRRMEVSTIYVTHDQVEAMTMGDRITVMRDGTLQRVDTSQHLYDNPDNIFVAAFIGSPVMNMYDAVVGDGARSLKLGSEEVDLPESVVLKLVGDVDLVEALGSELVVHFTLDAYRVLAEGAVDKDEAAAVKSGEGVALRQRQDPGQARRQADLRRGHP